MGDKFETFNEEYRSHLFSRLEKRAKNFMTLYRGTLIFAFAFLSFILIPLVVLQHDEYRYASAIRKHEENKKKLKKYRQEADQIEKRLGSLPIELKALKDKADRKEEEIKEINGKLEDMELHIDKNISQTGKLEEDEKRMAGIRERFQVLPQYDTQRNVNSLRDSLLQLGGYFDRPSGPELNDPCVSDDMNMFVRCKVKTIIRAEIEKYHEVIGDADDVLLSYVELDGKEQIEARINLVLAALDNLIRENPEFWRLLSGKFDFFRELEAPMHEVFREVQRQIHRYVNELDIQKDKIIADRQQLKEKGDRLMKELGEKQIVQQGINSEISQIDLKIKKLKADKAALSTKLVTTQKAVKDLDDKITQMRGLIDEIKKAKDDIENRLEKIQSPFGTLPVGLKEAVLAFPVALAVGIILFSLSLADMIRIRKDYHSATVSSYPDDSERIRNDISNVAPVWLDPLGDRSAGKWHMLMLALPVLAYVIALVLILYSWYIAEPQPGLMPFVRFGYFALYILGLLGFVFGGLQIWRERSAYQ